MSGLTPSQTVGPYLSLGLPWADGPVADAAGITIGGIVYDGAGVVIPDALIETWQPDPRAFARCPTDDDGRWAVTVPEPSGPVVVNVFARGMLHRVVTRIYLSEAMADATWEAVPVERRATLLATPDGDRAYRFDIRVQGDGETVFFDV